MRSRTDGLLDRLEEEKHSRPGGARLTRLLAQIGKASFSDAARLIRFHETLLFLRAYPESARVLARVEGILRGFPERVARLAGSGTNPSDFDEPEVSGIAGTSITTDYSFDVVAWLKRRHPGRVAIDWEGSGGADRLRALWPAFLPLLEEEALEDANVPYLLWLRQAQRKPPDDLKWLLEGLQRLPLSEKERAERFDALGLFVSWDLADAAASRTGMRRRARTIFFHDAPLLSRRDVSFEAEFAAPPIPVERLSRREGESILDMARGATALRYREYYGFTYGAAATVRRARVGRGVEIFLSGLQPGRRLPLRAGFAAFMVKNGVPVGYVEALAFFERIEIGFNIYYAYRDGESAWIFGKVLKLLRQVLRVSSFSIDPYQIGHENREAIESGAFWFYRKLGFRSTSPPLRKLTEAEEKKLAADPEYRTPPRVLKRLAACNVLYEAGGGIRSDWDDFHIRNLGLAVNRRMARGYAGDAEAIRRASTRRVARVLGVAPQTWPAVRRRAFEDLALVLDLVPDLSRWTREEKAALAAITRAKSGADEAGYLRLMQKHARLRAAMLSLGCSPFLISSAGSGRRGRRR